MRLSQCLLSHLYSSIVHKLLYQDRPLLSNMTICLHHHRGVCKRMNVCVDHLLWSDPTCLALLLSLGRYSLPPHVSSELSSERFPCSRLFFPEQENSKCVCAYDLPRLMVRKTQHMFWCSSRIKL